MYWLVNIYISEADIEHELLINEPQFGHLLNQTYSTKFEPLLYEVYSDYPEKNDNIRWKIGTLPGVGGPEFKSRMKLQKKTTFTILEIVRCTDCKIIELFPFTYIKIGVKFENDVQDRIIWIEDSSDMTLFKDDDFSQLNPKFYAIAE